MLSKRRLVPRGFPFQAKQRMSPSREFRRHVFEPVEERIILAADLVVESVSAASSVLAGNGATLTVNWTVRNQGDAPTDVGLWFDTFYLSDDNLLNAGDRLISAKGAPPSAPVGVDGTYSDSHTMVVPSFDAGSKFLLVVANDFDDLNEDDHGNNVLARPITVTTPDVDLAIDSIEAPPLAIAGQPFTFEYDLALGTGADQALASRTDKIYLSTDNIIDGSDPVLAEVRIESPTSTSGGQAELTVPLGTALGDYQLIVQLDFFDEQFETNPLNQAGFFSPFTVTDSAPDLVVTSIIAPTTAVLGDEITVEWTVENQGNAVASLFEDDAIYLSTDMLLDPSDIQLDIDTTAAESPLANGANYTRSLDITLSEGDPSHAFLLVATDTPSHAQPELDESNNVLAHAISLSLPPLPDLVPTDLIAPAVVALGSTISIDYTVENQGSEPALAEFWEDGFYLSSDASFDPSTDTPLDVSFVDNEVDLDFLDPSEDYSLSFDLEISAGTVGNMFLLLVADSSNDQAEANENNNVIAVPIETQAPNLVMSDPVVPANVKASSPITVEFTVTNDSTVDAGAFWNDGVFLSSDPFFGGGDRLLSITSPPVNPLPGGGQYTPSLSVTIPRDAPLGTNYLLLFANYFGVQQETNQADNLIAVEIDIALPDANLQVTSIVPDVTSAFPDTGIQVLYDVTNTGTEPAEAIWSDRVYISTDATLDAGDRSLRTLGTSAFSPLAGGADYQIDAFVFVPDDVAPGDYFLIVDADYNNAQAETNEADNFLAVPFRVDAPGVDFIISNFTGPATAHVGEQITVNWTVTNQGVGEASGQWTDSLYLADAIPPTLLNPLHFENVNQTIPPGGSYMVEAIVTVPGSFDRLGQQFLQLDADDGDLIPEEDDANNLATLPITITAPDLEVTAVSSPATAVVGEQITVEWTVTNNGTVPAVVPRRDYIYLSDDNQLDAGDESLIFFPPLDSTVIPAGGSIVVSRPVTIPSTTSGNRFLLVQTDRNNSQAETDETNNVLAEPITINSIDLSIDSLSIPAADAVFGDTFDVTYTVRNAGDSTTTQSWSDAIYLVGGPLGERLLAERSADADTPLAAGATYNVVQSVTLPIDLFTPAGAYSIEVRTDFTNAQAETDNGNNSDSAAVNLTLPPLPDLIVSEIDAPAEGFQSQDFTLSWTVENQGTAEANGSWIDRVYLSTDGFLSHGDTLLGAFPFVGAVAAGASIERVQTLTFPELDGTFQIIIVTDEDGTLIEGPADANNTKVDGTPFPLTLPPRPDLVVTSITPPPDGVMTGQTLTFTYEVTNQGTAPTPTPFWLDGYFLAQDPNISISDPNIVGIIENLPWIEVFRDRSEHGGFGAQPPRVVNPTVLEPGESYQQTVEFQLLEGVAGPWYLYVSTDMFRFPKPDTTAGFVIESDGTNNMSVSSGFNVTLTPPPDLQVTNVVAPSQAFSGQSVEIAWTVTNEGTGGTPEDQWVDAVYLSTDDTLDGFDVLLGNFTHRGGLESGASYLTTGRVTLPQGISGDHKFLVVTDSNNDVFEHIFGNNNLGAETSFTEVLLTPPPDLEVLQITAPSAALASHTIEVSFEVANNGSTDVPRNHWFDAIYLSTDTTFDSATDTLLKSFVTFAPRTVGQTSSFTEQVVLPDGLSGDFFLFAAIDDFGHVFEIDKSNNVSLPAPISIESRPADLTIVSTSVPNNPIAGHAIAVTWTVENQGTGDTAVAGWRDTIYLSTDDQFDSGDSIIAEFDYSGVLNAGASVTRTEVFTIPVNVIGSRHLFVRTDAPLPLFPLGQVFEDAAEGNNVTGPIAANVIRQTADLTVPNVTIPATILAGDTITVDWTVENIGPVATNASYWYDDIYLSSNAIAGDADDLFLGSRYRSEPLATGGQYAGSLEVTLPEDLPTGDYHIVVRTDRPEPRFPFDGLVNRVLEDPSESNNNGFSPLTTISQPDSPDLIVTAVDAPSNSFSGQFFSVSWTVENVGEAGASANWIDSVYLSLDQVFDPTTDVYLGFVERTADLPVGQSYSDTGSFRIPNSISGPLYVFVQTDSGDAIYEAGRELNNAARDPVSMLAGSIAPVDLVAGTITIPATAMPGDSVTIDYTVNNAGTNPALGSWFDTLYLSADDQWDLNDPVLGSVFHQGDVPGGTSYSESLTAELPGVIPGEYHVVVRSDIRRQIVETNETNNIGASLDRTLIDIPAVVLGTASNETLTEKQSRFFQVDVPAGETLRFFLDAHDDSASTELHVSFNQVPNRQDANFRNSVPFAADHEILVPTTEAGTYYVLVYGDQVSGSASFDLLAEIIPFSVTAVSPSTVGNAGRSTLKVTGARFDLATEFELVGSGAPVAAANVHLQDSSTAFVTFDLGGAAIESYDVLARNSLSEETTLIDGLDVVAGAGASLRTNVTVPERTVAGRGGTFDITYRNEGDADQPAPLFVVHSPTSSQMGLDPAFLTPRANIRFFATSSDGPAGILRPGQIETIPISFVASNQVGDQYTFELGFYDANNTEPLDLDLVLGQLSDDEFRTQADWPQIRAELVSRLGSTWGEYVRALSGIASLLPAELGDSRDPVDLLHVIARQAQAAVGASISGAINSSDPTASLGGRTVTAYDASQDALYLATTLNDGSFTVPRVIPGNYEFTVGNAVTQPTDFDVDPGQSITNVELVVEPGITVSGTVATNNFLPVEGALVKLALDDGTSFHTVSQTDGFYAIGGLPMGTYSVSASREGFGEAIVSDLELVDSNVEQALVLRIEGVISGEISIDPGGPAETSLLILARPSIANPNQIGTYFGVSAGNTYSINGLPPGTYDIVFQREGYVRHEVNGVVVGNGSRVELSAVAIALAGSISGTVTSSDPNLPAEGAFVGAFVGETLVVGAQADEGGGFTLLNVPPGTYSIRTLELNSFFSGPEVTVAPGDEVTGVKLEVIPGGRIFGNVVDPVSLNALVGASVRLIPANGDSIVAVTDDSGNYEFNGLDLGAYEVGLVGANGAEHVQIEITDLEGQEFEIPLEFIGSIEIAGQLKDSGGNPIRGGVHLFQDGNLVGTTLTDENGHYSLLLLESGTFDLLAVSDEATFSRQTGIVLSAGQSATQDLIAGTAVLEVTVTDSSQSVNGAAVFLLEDSTNEVLASMSVNATGVIEFANLAPGDYRVEVVNESSRQGSDTVVISTGGSFQSSVDLVQLPVLSGVVFDSNSVPVNGAVVQLYAPGDSFVVQSAVTGSDGTYVVTHVPPGDYDVVAYGSGFQATTVASVSLANDAQQNLTLSPSTSFAVGNIVDQFGNPVPLAQVVVFDSTGRAIGAAFADSAGMFTVNAEGSGLTLVVTHNGYFRQELANIDIPPGQTVDTLQTTMPGVSVAADPTPVDSLAKQDQSLLKRGNPLSTIAYLFNIYEKGQFYHNVLDGSHDLKAKDVTELPDCSGCGQARIDVLTGIDVMEKWRTQARVAASKLMVTSTDTIGTGITEGAIITAKWAAVAIGVRGMMAQAGFMAQLSAETQATLLGLEIIELGNTILSLGVQLFQFIGQVAAGNEGADVLQWLVAATSAANDIQSRVGGLLSLLKHVAENDNIPGKLGSLDRFLTGIGPISTALSGILAFFSDPFQNTMEGVRDVIREEKEFDILKKQYFDQRKKVVGLNQTYERCLQNDAADAAKRCECQDGNCNNGDASVPGARASVGGSGTGQVSAPLDPNDIIGPDGFGDDRWIAPFSSLEYMIRFENIDTATAPAQIVTLTHQLDQNLDFRTFRVDDFGFGATRKELPGDRPFFQQRIDLTDTAGHFVDVTGTIDVQTGIASWTFKTIDPATGDLPEDGFNGFLPPNIAEGIGEGFVTFSVRPKDSVTTGDTIDALATIIFDTQPPIDTPLWRNTIDRDLPFSSVLAQPATSATDVFQVEWSGADLPGGSGLADFTIFVAEDDGPFVPWLQNITLTASPFIGERGHEYRFYSVAHDNAGNSEAAPPTADLSVTLSGIVGRHLFYNQSSFDGNDSAINTADDAAIALDKQPLMPGQTASHANYSSYHRGINGLMIDLFGMPPATALSASDFEFRVGNNDDSTSWPLLTAQPTIDIRTDGGANGSDRITLTWPSGTIAGRWLQVRLKSTANTGLLADDVFYFGNAPGETGTTAHSAFVDAIDFAGTRANSRTLLDPATITDPYDHNRDGLVDVSDLAIIRDTATGLANVLQLISPPIVAGKAASLGSGESDKLGNARKIIEHLHNTGGATSVGDRPDYDINRDQQVTLADALMLIGELRHQVSSADKTADSFAQSVDDAAKHEAALAALIGEYNDGIDPAIAVENTPEIDDDFEPNDLALQEISTDFGF